MLRAITRNVLEPLVINDDSDFFIADCHLVVSYTARKSLTGDEVANRVKVFAVSLAKPLGSCCHHFIVWRQDILQMIEYPSVDDFFVYSHRFVCANTIVDELCVSMALPCYSNFLREELN